MSETSRSLQNFELSDFKLNNFNELSDYDRWKLICAAYGMLPNGKIARHYIRCTVEFEDRDPAWIDVPLDFWEWTWEKRRDYMDRRFKGWSLVSMIEA